MSPPACARGPAPTCGAITAPQAQAAPPPHVQERKAAKAKKRLCATQDLSSTLDQAMYFGTIPAPVLCTKGYPAELEKTFAGTTTWDRWFDMDLHLDQKGYDGYYYLMFGTQLVAWQWMELVTSFSS